MEAKSAKDIEVEYLGYDNVGNGRVYGVYEDGEFKGGFVLEDFIFGNDTRQAEFEEMAYRMALDVAKDANAKPFPLSAQSIPYVLKCRHCCIEGKHYEVK